MDPTFTTALFVTIYFCANGNAKNGICSDGSPQQERSMSIITREPNGVESLIEYDVNSIPKFVLHPDGSITRSGDFQVDDYALAFWQAIANTYKQSCSDIATVLKSIEGPK